MEDLRPQWGTDFIHIHDVRVAIGIQGDRRTVATPPSGIRVPPRRVAKGIAHILAVFFPDRINKPGRPMHGKGGAPTIQVGRAERLRLAPGK